MERNSDGAISINREIGAMIYRVDSDSSHSYSFGPTWVGAENHVVPGFIWRLLFPEHCPSGLPTQQVGFVHTHPFDSHNFSDEDKMISHGQLDFSFAIPRSPLLNVWTDTSVSFSMPPMPVYMTVNRRPEPGQSQGYLEVWKHTNYMHVNSQRRIWRTWE
jgi:hypothetical protein